MRAPTLALALSIALSASVAMNAFGAPVPAIFEDLVAREVMMATRAGSEMVGRVTVTGLENLTDASFRSFLERMTWRQMSPLRNEVAGNLQQISAEFRTFRQQAGRAPELRAGEVLLADERAFLEAAAEARFRSNKINNLLLETTAFVEIRPARPGSSSESFSPPAQTPGSGTAAARAVGEVPALPSEMVHAGPNTQMPDLSAAKRTYWRRIADRFRIYRNFFRAFRSTEGQWRNIFTASGKPFRRGDWEMIRKYNRLFEVLNEYSRMRLVIKSFAMERPVLYRQLNEKTAEATAAYIEGTLGEAEYIAARKAVAAELKLNDIVGEAETRMLRAVRRCKELGGGNIGNTQQRSLIDMSEDNIRAYQAHQKRIADAMTQADAQLRVLRPQTSSGTAAERAAASHRIRELQLRNLRDSADKDLWALRERGEIKELKRMYLEFVEAHDTLEMFANLRRGRINGEEVQAFDLPDPFVPVASEVRIWDQFYDRALYNSTNELVLNETKLFFRSQAGATRTFVRDMNKLTGKYFGKRFTDSALGREFLDYNRHAATVFVTRLGKLLGVTIPSGLAVTYADKLWAMVFGDDAATGGDEPTPTDDGDGTDSAPVPSSPTSSDHAPAPVPAPAPTFAPPTTGGNGGGSSPFPGSFEPSDPFGQDEGDPDPMAGQNG